MIKDFSKLPYDKKKQIEARKHPVFYTTDAKYTRGQALYFCNKCGDTSFELLDYGEATGKCCRCGGKF